ncbi:MAG TPA: hypothetical protein VF296_02020 [Gallionella sp.]
MNKTYITAILVVTSLAFSAGAMAQSMSKSEYETSKNGISTKLESAKANCRSVTGNRKELTEICVGNAERQGKIAKANLEAQYNPTEQTRNEALDAKVKAKDDYLSKTKKDGAQASLATDADKTVDKQRAANYATANNECNTLGGTTKISCINNLLEQYNKMSE